MQFDHYHAHHQHEEYERKIQAFQAERRAITLSAKRPNVATRAIGASGWLLNRVAATVWQWGQTGWKQLRPVPFSANRQAMKHLK